MVSTDLTPTKAIMTYGDSLAAALPSHVNPKQWLAVAIDAVRRNPAIEKAAQQDMGRFFAALRNAARRGLEPGTEQYYLVPFGGKIEGIVGYRGMVEMMYRAGAVKSVIAELVHTKDKFQFTPGKDAIPHHEIDWWADDRGDILGAYAYAQLEDGVHSKVVVMSRAQIDATKRRSPSASAKQSPWTTDYPAMALKTVVRQLEKWVPTSAEYRRELTRADQVWTERLEKADQANIPDYQPGPGEAVDPVTGELLIVDAEVVDEVSDEGAMFPKESR